MWKSVLAGTTALAIVGTTIAYAQRPARPDGANHWRPSAADITALGDARIAAIHAGLQLTPDQEKMWPPVESALRERSQQRSARFAARASADRPKDPIERLSTRAQMMQERGATLKKVADAAAPLYKSLDDGQKHRFMMLARLGGERGEHGRGHHEWRHRGPGGPANDGPKPQ
jgi:hypothetical protein